MSDNRRKRLPRIVATLSACAHHRRARAARAYHMLHRSIIAPLLHASRCASEKKNIKRGVVDERKSNQAKDIRRAKARGIIKSVVGKRKRVKSVKRWRVESERRDGKNIK